MNDCFLALRLAFIALVVCACATYKSPDSGPTATMAFTGNHAYVYVDDGNSCSSRKKTARESWPALTVKAGQFLWIEQGVDTTGLPYGYKCSSAYSFVPEAGARYVSEYVNDFSRCRVLLQRVLEDGRKVIEPSAKVEDPRTCLF